MKTISLISTRFIFAALLSMSMYACSFSKKGSGSVTTETRAESNFNSIDVKAGIKVFYSASNDYKVEVVTDDNLVGYIKTEVKGKELNIFIQRNKQLRKITTLEVYLSAPSLSGIKLSGASSFEGTFNDATANCSVNSSGASTSILNGNFLNLTADLSGASTLTAKGSSTSAAIEGSGASTFSLSECAIENLSAKLSGASKSTVTVNQLLTTDLSGNSSVYYYGNPTVSSELSGGSTVEKR